MTDPKTVSEANPKGPKTKKGADLVERCDPCPTPYHCDTGGCRYIGAPEPDQGEDVLGIRKGEE